MQATSKPSLVPKLTEIGDTSVLNKLLAVGSGLKTNLELSKNNSSQLTKAVVTLQGIFKND